MQGPSPAAWILRKQQRAPGGSVGPQSYGMGLRETAQGPHLIVLDLIVLCRSEGVGEEPQYGSLGP